MDWIAKNDEMRMKVLFTFSGLPHYLIVLLNRLVSYHGINVNVVIPKNRGISLGEGIKLGDVEDEYLFSVFQLEEYRGKFNKPYFMNLHALITQVSPDIMVMGWPYILNYSLDFSSRRVIRRNNISLVFREIPFMVAPKNQATKYYRKYPILNENLEIDNPGGLLFYPWAFGLNQMRKIYYKLADATLIYASHGFKIHESFGISRDRIFLTYNSPDTDKIAKTRIMLEEKGLALTKPGKILHLGRLVKWKRVDLLIDAVSQLHEIHGNIELSIIGSGPEEENLKRMARIRLPEGAVKFHGAIYDSEELAKEIISSAIYVLGGMGGLSINEVMAYGLPVICSRCDGTERDLISDGQSGLFFKEGDPVDLASKIEILLSDPNKSRAMGKNAFSVIEDKINLETVTQRYANCFEFLMLEKESTKGS